MRLLKPAFFRRHCIKSYFKVCKKQRFRRIYEHIFGIIIFGDEFNASTCVFEGMSKTLIKWTLLDDTHQCKEVLCATQSHELEAGWAAILALPCSVIRSRRRINLNPQPVIASVAKQSRHSLSLRGHAFFYGRGNLSFDLFCHCEHSESILFQFVIASVAKQSCV